ncbi:unnamed protein product [Rotaria sordida]|uniref:Uncharacterized protein n=1 Tax=Rotaria sordida TaxID=392033 RepID=A0A820ITI0_9BILA|nr:unnamed protein product [Rotaria sordida]
MSCLAFLLFILTILSCSIKTIIYRPVVLMHGIVAFTSDMNELAGWLRTSFPGIYIVICNDIHLQQGFNMLEFSQRSLIGRDAVEQCSFLVYNLIT